MILSAVVTTAAPVKKAAATAVHHFVIHQPSTFLGYPDVQSWLHDWLPIIFMGLLVVGGLLADALHAAHEAGEDQGRLGPPDRLGGDRRRRRGQGGAARDRRLPARPQALPRDRRQGPQGRPPPRTARARARRCWPRPWRTNRARPSSPSRRPRSSRCSSASARRASAGCSSAARKHVPGDRVHRRARRRRRPPRHDISGERDQTLNQLLVEMDGFTSRKDVVVIAASNLLEKLDPAPCCARAASTARSSSPRPTSCGRERILGIHSRNKPLARRRRPAPARPPDLGPHRRRPGQHLQRGGHLRRPPRRQDRAHARLRLRARARRRRHAVAPRADRPREARRRLPRGRPRPVRRAAALGGSRAPDLDRPPRQGAGLHAQPARGGPLPQDP